MAAEIELLGKEVKDIAEKVKAGMTSLEQKLTTELDTRLTALNAQTADRTKQDEALKGEVENLVSKLNAIQGHVDKIDMNLQKSVNQRAKGTNFLRSTLEANIEKIKQMSNRDLRAFNLDLKGNEDLFQMRRKDITIAGSTTGDVITQEFFPGIIYDPERPRHIREVMTVSATSAGSKRYIVEASIDNQTGVIAEAGQYAESNVTLEEKTAPAVKIGSIMQVSRESLDDIAGLSGYLGQRFIKLLRVKEDQQLLYGTGLSNQLTGIKNVSGIQSWSDTLADSAVQRIDVLVAAVTQAMVNNYPANAIVLSPVDVQNIRLLKGSDEHYLYPQVVMGSGGMTIAGATVVENTAVTVDDFFVGDFAMGAILFDKYEPEILFSTEDSTNFQYDLVTIKVSEKVILQVHRPKAFIYDTFTTATAKGSA